MDTIEKFVIATVFSILLALCNAAFADNNVNIKSDCLTINKNDTSAIFSGSVILTFQDLKLYCSSLKIHYGDNSAMHKIREIIIPDKLKLVKNTGNEVVFADTGHFDNISKKLTLKGNVKMLKEDNVLVTDKLVYLAEFEEISKGSNAK